MNEFFLHHHRTVSEKLNITFSFIREHQSLLFKSTWILSLPLIIALTSYSTLYTIASQLVDTPKWLISITENGSDSIWENAIVIAAIFTTLLIVPMVLSIIKLTTGMEAQKGKIDMSDIAHEFKSGLPRTIVMPYAPIILVYLWMPIANFIYIGNYDFLDSIGTLSLLLLAFSVLCMSLPAYIIDRKDYAKSLFTSISNGLRYFFSNLWFIVMLIFVCMLLGVWMVVVINLLSQYRIDIIGYNPMDHPIAYSIYWILLGISSAALAYMSIIALVAATVGIAFQYGSITDTNEHVSLKDRIENFESLNDE